MAAITGKGGKVTIGGSSTVGEAKQWTINPGRDIIETTPLGVDAKTKIYGLFDWTAKMTANWDPGDTTGQMAIVNALIGGTTIDFAGFQDGTHNYAGTCLVKGYSIKVEPNSAIEIDFDLEGSGALAIT